MSFDSDYEFSAADLESLKRKADELRQEIELLPIGSIGKKNINGRIYYYHRFYENGKRKEKYIPQEGLESMQAAIERRKRLENELKALDARISQLKSAQTPSLHYRYESRNAYDAGDFTISSGIRSAGGASYNGIPLFYGSMRVSENLPEYRCNVIRGAALRNFSMQSAGFGRRECFSRLHDFVYGDFPDKVLILYGLRRTGKTTMIRQLIEDMDENMLERTAFLQVSPECTLSDVNFDLKLLATEGYLYIFIDEVTLLDDFIEGAALFSDIFASCGMKIVLSGTDSLGFVFSEDSQLYDRCVMLHTTFIPYGEFERLLGVRGIDEYIRYGGTLSMSGKHYNESSTFATSESTSEYVDSAIAKNIQHSLKCYQDGNHFRSLYSLYEKNELTSAINRVVEDINQRFTLDILTRDFRSSALAVSARNLRRDRHEANDILDRIDIKSVTERLRKKLEILNSTERSVEISESHCIEIKEYLDLLDLTFDFEIVTLPNLADKYSKTVVSQPGLRYSQSDAIVSALLEDHEFSDLSLADRNYVLERIRSEILGRLTEDLVLLETKIAYPKKRVLKLQFAVGEFDMLVFDPKNASCEIYEVKHSDKRDKQQYRHLTDSEKCEMTEFRYGSITGKYVLYRGEPYFEAECGVEYLNVEDYLRSLSQKVD